MFTLSALNLLTNALGLELLGVLHVAGQVGGAAAREYTCTLNAVS